jgi:hypothetical protein
MNRFGRVAVGVPASVAGGELSDRERSMPFGRLVARTGVSTLLAALIAALVLAVPVATVGGRRPRSAGTTRARSRRTSPMGPSRSATTAWRRPRRNSRSGS